MGNATQALHRDVLEQPEIGGVVNSRVPPLLWGACREKRNVFDYRTPVGHDLDGPRPSFALPGNEKHVRIVQEKRGAYNHTVSRRQPARQPAGRSSLSEWGLNDRGARA